MKTALLLALAVCGALVFFVGWGSSASGDEPTTAPAAVELEPVFPTTVQEIDTVGKPGAKPAANGYYTQVYTAVYDKERDPLWHMEGTCSLKEINTILGPAPKASRPIWRLRPSTTEYVEEPYVYFSGRRYLVMRGSFGSQAKPGQPREFVRIVDLDQTVVEARLQAALNSPAQPSHLPELDVVEATEEQFKAWVAQVEKKIADGVTIEDISARLGRPSYVHYDRPGAGPLEVYMSYAVRDHKTLARWKNAKSFAYPVIKVHAEGDKVTKVEFYIATDSYYGPGELIF